MLLVERRLRGMQCLLIRQLRVRLPERFHVAHPWTESLGNNTLLGTMAMANNLLATMNNLLAGNLVVATLAMEFLNFLALHLCFLRGQLHTDFLEHRANRASQFLGCLLADSMNLLLGALRNLFLFEGDHD